MAELPISSKFIFATDERVMTEPTVPGVMIFTNTGRLFLDRPDNGQRIEITDVRVNVTEVDRLAIMEPITGFYYVSETAKLYRYLGDHRWDCLNPDPPFIGPDGKVMIDYLPGYGDQTTVPGEPGSPGEAGHPGVPGDVVILGPGGVVPEGYLAVASSNRYGTVRLGSLGGAARFGHPEDIGLGELIATVERLKLEVAELKTQLGEK